MTDFQIYYYLTFLKILNIDIDSFLQQLELSYEDVKRKLFRLKRVMDKEPETELQIYRFIIKRLEEYYNHNRENEFAKRYTKFKLKQIYIILSDDKNKSKHKSCGGTQLLEDLKYMLQYMKGKKVNLPN